MPRKANGESSIYQDANGTWHGWVSMGLTDNGKPDRRHVTGQRRPAVLTKVRALQQQREAGCRVHMKPNLSRSSPGMALPDEYPVPRRSSGVKP